MWPFSSWARNISWVVVAWFLVPVVVNRSQLIPSWSHWRQNSPWYRSTMSDGDTPSASARTVIGVPWTSEPLTINTSLPTARCWRAKMSAGR